jgi:hypothetical protein
MYVFKVHNMMFWYNMHSEMITITKIVYVFITPYSYNFFVCGKNI